MNHTALDREPPLLLDNRNESILRNVAKAAMDRAPEVATLLLAEVDRAEIVSEAELPDDVVTIGSFVTYQIQLTGAINTVRLVLPQQADLSKMRVSIVSGIGAALIGLRAGQQIDWVLGGRRHVLEVIRVSREP
ncbi:nucleoside diphosphate kinase regulator [Sinimarinibacterium sp. CAU 1509]|uniref:nucleoside diphosphate kinase regulator n=1 Tax=Sinimarinibacterium sp. CAU 1509 TaxID=2562283 RepID=UPI0010AB67BE|nr:nucleoside diphosphate kinase regulator [Sinimarinibacterium sp. CAU 1509]TJY55417.1 nucleoside diphosphate kinase regulator [Sinimarinibacterium sp. CAU 1509]